MKLWIHEREVLAIAKGSAYLGAGGGGISHNLLVLTARAVAECGPVPLISAFELADHEWIVPVSLIGSPLMFNEKVMTGYETIDALREIESILGIQASGLTTLEIGGLNALTPIFTAIKTGLPIIDCDGMGRAFPQLQMTSFHAFEVPASPFVFCRDTGHCEHLVHATSWQIEEALRSRVLMMGGWAVFAGFSMQAKRLKETAFHRSYSVCMGLGEAALEAGGDIHRFFKDMVRTCQSSLYGKPLKLIEGKVVDLHREIRDGLLSGQLTVQGTGIHISEQVEVSFLTEFTQVKRGAQHLVTVPDLICILDADTAEPIMIEDLENHHKVWVVAIPCPYLMRHPKMLEVVGPASFGLACEYEPVEVRVQESEVMK